MRLDYYLYESGEYPSRTKASEAVTKGEVLYNGKLCKPSQPVTDVNAITFNKTQTAFVSNGGYKLEKALTDFCFDVKNLIFADVGASNGGFTHCLLMHGAKHVYAIDVGESQLDKTLSNDERVTVIDKFNARFLSKDALGELVDGVVADVSFISLTYILNSVYSVLKEGGVAILLIKPQFECGKEYLGKSGIVKDVKARKNACLKIYDYAVNIGFTPTNFTIAPIKEKKNVEYVIMLEKNGSKNILPFKDIEKVITQG